jgi:hypothetical protein
MTASLLSSSQAATGTSPPLTTEEMRVIPFAGGNFVADLDTADLHDAFDPFGPERLASHDLRYVMVEMPTDDGTGHYNAAVFDVERNEVTLLDLRTMIRLTAAYAIHDHRFDEEAAEKVLRILKGYRMSHHFVSSLPDGFSDGWTGTRLRFDPDTGTLTAQIHPLPAGTFIKVGPARAELSAGGQGQVRFQVQRRGGKDTALARYTLPGAANLRDVKAFADIVNGTPRVTVHGALVRSDKVLDLMVSVEQITLSHTL